jgi:acyl carrier protein
MRRLLRVRPGPQAIISTRDLALALWQKKDDTAEGEAVTTGRIYARTNLDRPIDLPTNPTETLLVPIWTEVLGVSPIGTHDDFFDLGGDSLIGLRMTARLKDLGIHVAIEQIFQYHTIRELAAVIEHEKLVPAEITQSLSAGANDRQSHPMPAIKRLARKTAIVPVESFY